MNERDNYRADGFIARWIAGELTDAEKEAFERWVRTNPGERQYFDELKTIWLDYGAIKLADGLSKSKRWDHIRKRLFRNSEP
jgi:ferric-dicitrate binding protein FerR (iron transport regulator)